MSPLPVTVSCLQWLYAAGNTNVTLSFSVLAWASLRILSQLTQTLIQLRKFPAIRGQTYWKLLISVFENNLKGLTDNQRHLPYYMYPPFPVFFGKGHDERK